MEYSPFDTLREGYLCQLVSTTRSQSLIDSAANTSSSLVTVDPRINMVYHKPISQTTAQLRLQQYRREPILSTNPPATLPIYRPDKADFSIIYPLNKLQLSNSTTTLTTQNPTIVAFRATTIATSSGWQVGPSPVLHRTFHHQDNSLKPHSQDTAPPFSTDVGSAGAASSTPSRTRML